MKAIVVTAIGKVELQELPQPVPGPGQVRIRTGACGICATDLTMIHGCERSHYPAILGHEWSGIVDAVGDGVDDSLVGSHCVGENVLRDGGEVGFEHPGGYGEYLVTEASNIHVLPRDFSLTTAALIEPLAVGVRGFTRLRAEDNSRALIFGDGPIGLIMLMLLKLDGFENIVLVGGRRERLRTASDMGAEQVINYHEIKGDLTKAIRDSTEGLFPNVIEASGSSAAMKASLELTAPCAIF